MRTELAIAIVLGAGCGSLTTYQTAEPLPKGRWQVAGAITPGLFVDLPSNTNTPTAITELHVRRGFGGDTDAGIKLFSIGAELNVKHRIVDAGWQWALLGAVVWARNEDERGITPSIYGQLRLAAAATKRFDERWAITVGPVLSGAAYDFAGGGSATGVTAGAFANYQWTFGSRKRWHLIHELSAHATVVGDVPVDGFVTMFGVAIARDL